MIRFNSSFSITISKVLVINGRLGQKTSDSLREASTSCIIKSGQFSLFHGLFNLRKAK